jgi:hypothetical protein
MRRIVAFGVVAVMMLVASTASAQWYMGLGLAGTTMDDVFMYGYRDMVPEGYNGVFDDASMAIGYSMDAFDLEFELGYSTQGYEEEWDYTRFTETMDYTRYTFGMAGLYHLVGNEKYGIDAGAKFQLVSEKAEYDNGDGYTWEDDYSGWAIGPVLRGRVFFADGHMAIGPEIYFKYSTKTLEESETGDDTDEVDFTKMGLEYGIRLDFLF